MENTLNYFDMTIDEALATDENGYTKEERKLFDEGFRVHFAEDEEEHKNEREDVIRWYFESQGLLLIKELVTINKRIAMIFN